MTNRTAKRTLALFALFASSIAGFAQSPAASLYTAKCQMCHSADGSASSPAGKMLKARPFNSPDVIKESATDLTAIVKNGKNKMPAFTGKLTDAQIKDMVAYVLTLEKK
jgi:cytochrome c6